MLLFYVQVSEKTDKRKKIWDCFQLFCFSRTFACQILTPEYIRLFKFFVTYVQILIQIIMINKVILIGNVGADPEIRYLDGGVAVARFSLATTESYKNKNGEKVDQTEWHNIVLWRNLAEIAEKYVRKGMRLYIEGRIRNRSWEDQNGVKRYMTEIQGDTMQMLSPKQENGEYAPSRNYETPGVSNIPSQPATPIADDNDDLPF